MHKRQCGQAATEFLIAAAFVLVPLFLIVPLLGKYIDIKHAAIQHARFTAWEYTVMKSEEKRHVLDFLEKKCNDAEDSGVTEEKGIGYFFADPTSPTYGSGAQHMSINPLWSDNRKDRRPLFAVADISTTLLECPTPAPAGVIGRIGETLFQFLGNVFSLFGELLHAVGVDAKFDAINTKGYYTSDVQVAVRSLEQVLSEEPAHAARGLVIHARAGVQTDGWNAGSSKNATAESRGLVVTSLLAPLSSPINRILGKINRLLNKIPLLKIKLPAMPEFGYVQDDLIPLEHLEGNKKKLQDKKGLNSYE